MAATKMLSYVDKGTWVHRLTGSSKLLMVLFFSIAGMITYDTRLLLGMVLISVFLFIQAKISLREVKVVVVFLSFFLVMNTFLMFLFAPEHGTLIYGTRTELFHIIGRYYVTAEQLFFQLNVAIKYMVIMPIALVFFITTDPSEFAASLNKIGLSYKVAYSVSLTMRYIPDIQREFFEISQSYQARGLDLSKNTSLIKRIQGVGTVLFPLIVTSIEKIDRIANAMELRSFGKHKKRTWYRAKAFSPMDYVLIILSAALIAIAILLIQVNNGRFFNPFSLYFS